MKDLLVSFLKAAYELAKAIVLKIKDLIVALYDKYSKKNTG